MTDVFDVVVRAGSIPFDELRIRTSAPDLQAQVDALERRGLVEVKSENVIGYDAPVQVIALSKKGFRAAIR